jgi:hypothetical protein
VRRTIVILLVAIMLAGGLCPAFAASAPKVTAAPSNTVSSGTSASGGHLEYYYEDAPCFNCHGTGTCPLCHGTGTYRMYGQSVPCDRQCSACSGSGVIPSLRSRWVAD